VPSARTFQVVGGRAAAGLAPELVALDGGAEYLKCSSPALPGFRTRPSFDAAYYHPSVSPRVPQETRSFRPMCGEPVRFEARRFILWGRTAGYVLRVRYLCLEHARLYLARQPQEAPGGEAAIYPDAG